MLKNMKKYLIFAILTFISFNSNVNALTGVVNVNDSLTLRDAPSTAGGYLTSFSNGTTLEVLNTNAGVGNGCDSAWYQVQYGGYTGYSCGTFINLVTENTSTTEDDSFSIKNYSTALDADGSIMCYEDTGSLSIRDSVNGGKTGKVVDCGEKVQILETEETPNKTCPYWYKIKRNNDEGYVCGYFVNTTKLSSTAENYYNNNEAGETIESYKETLTTLKFPESYHPYLLELHARHANWNFVPEILPMTFTEAVNGESVNGRSLLQQKYFSKGYLSAATHTYNLWNDTFSDYTGEPGYANASKEAIAYYLDPRNYLNEKYIFAFETLGYSANQDAKVVSSILVGQDFWPAVYNYYTLPNAILDTTGNVNDDIVHASSTIGISAVHVAARIKQEMTGVSPSNSRLGGGFTYNGGNYSNYYNFYNIKSKCSNCSSIYAGYAYENGWNTPYKGLYGGASFMYNGYIALNQDTIYYEKFDVSTNNGHYTHQYMQNLAATAQEGGTKHKGYIEALPSYLSTGITFVIPVYQEMPEYVVTAPKIGSPNNYLSDIKINDVSVSNFSYDTYNYNVYLAKNTTKVNIKAIQIISSATISGAGDIEITEDNQINRVVVTAENGKTRTYTINFVRDTIEGTTIEDAMNNSGFKYNDTYLFGINVGTNVSELIANIRNYNHSVGVVIKDKNGNQKTNDSFRTGDQVTITGTNGDKNYTVLIFGDIDGDGTIDKKDLLAVQSKVFGYTSFDNLKNSSADINKDGTVDKKDLLAVQSHVFGYSQIKQG